MVVFTVDNKVKTRKDGKQKPEADA